MLPLSKRAEALAPSATLAWRGKAMESATDLADYLLEEGHTATVSGDPFGAPGHIRCSYATSRKNIEEGTRRLAAALKRLSS